MLGFVMNSALQGGKARAVQALAALSVSDHTSFRTGATAFLANDRSLKPEERTGLKIMLSNYLCDKLETTVSVLDRAPTPAEVKKLRAVWPPRPTGAKGSPLRTFLLDYRLNLRYGGTYIGMSIRQATATLDLSRKETKLLSKLIDGTGNLNGVSNMVPFYINRSQLKRIDAAITEVLANESFWRA